MPPKKQQAKILQLDEFVTKVTRFKNKNPLDLSSDQDLSIALMNLISIEEHFFFSGGKTANTKYYDLINEVRAMRSELLGKLIPKYNDGSERWCISKHLLAASMRLFEVGCKQLGSGHKEVAYDFFNKAYELYSLFWGVNLEVVDIGTAQELAAVAEGGSGASTSNNSSSNKGAPKKSKLLTTLGKMVRKAIDCCLE